MIFDVMTYSIMTVVAVMSIVVILLAGHQQRPTDSDDIAL
jgi:hypothetical protein